MSYTANDFSYSGDSKEQNSSGEEIDEVQLPAKKDNNLKQCMTSSSDLGLSVDTKLRSVQVHQGNKKL